MNIVINAFSARLGGGQTYLLNLLNYIPERADLKVTVLAPIELELPAHPAIIRYNPNIKLDNPLVRTAWEKFVLPRYLCKIKADVLFCPGGVVVTAVPSRCKVVTMFRNMIPFDSKVLGDIPFGLQRVRNWLLYHTMLRSMAQADLTIFISSYARNIIEGLVSIPNPVTIAHGIGKEFRTSGMLTPHPDELMDKNYLLYVSRFDVYKHHCEVVIAYSKLPEMYRAKFPLVLIGESELPGAERVHKLIDSLDLNDQIMVMGAVPYAKLPIYYHHAKAVIFASSCENCPNILLEALGAGRPVISSNVMPMPEFGGDAVAYFSPFKPDEILDAMLRVLSDEEYSANLSAAATIQSEKFKWSNTAFHTWNNIFKLVEDAN